MNNNLSARQDLVLRYLKNKEAFLDGARLTCLYYGTRGITVKEGMDVLGTTEIRKIMSEFRQSGYRVIDVWENGENKLGHETRYKRYYLKGKINNDK